MISHEALEEAILCLLCFSDSTCLQIAAKLTTSKVFTNPTNQTMARAAMDYIAQYTNAPGNQLNYLLENELRQGERGKLIADNIMRFSTLINELDTSFILRELDIFIELQEMNRTLEEASGFLEAGELDRAKERLYRHRTRPESTAPIWLLDPQQSLSSIEEDEQMEFISIGVDYLDRRGIRPEKKTLTLFIAAAGKGKSWFLVGTGKAGLQFKKKVLHITLEMSQKKTARRYLQSIFSLTKADAQTIRGTYFIQEDDRLGMQYLDFTRPSILERRAELHAQLNAMQRWPPLVIKEFPTGSLSLEQLEMYIESLLREHGFKPDVVILDYADLMRIDAESLRIDTGRTFRDLRGMAARRDFALVTATQSNRESEKVKLVRGTNVAEDWSKIATSDNVITYSQTLAEHQMGLARLFVEKGRDESDKFITLISQAYPIGQFCLDSTLMTTDLINQIEGGGETRTTTS